MAESRAHPSGQDTADARATGRRRAQRALVIGVALFFAIPVIVYAAIAARFYTGKPTVARNYAAEWNARFDGVPEEDLAWSLYVRAIPTFPPNLRELIDVWPNVRPDDPGWDDARAWLRERAAGVDLLRTAAQRPTLGHRYRDSLHPDYAAAIGATGDMEIEAGTPNENPMLMNVLFPMLGDMRRFARALAMDAIIAAHEGDGERCAANLRASLGLLDHAAEGEILIARMVAASMANTLCVAVDRVLDEHAESLSDAHLEALLVQLSEAIERGAFKLQFGTQRLIFDDMLQRMYTDDGKGGGRLTPEGFRTLHALADGGLAPETGQRLSMLGRLAAPLGALAVADRRAMHDTYHAFVDACEQAAQAPLWAVDPTPFDRHLEDPDWGPGGAYELIGFVAVAIERAYAAGELAHMRLDGARVAVAIELFKRRHGRYPDHLDELVPDVLPEIPPDRYDGKPVKYALRDGRPVVYSVGVDRKDDGGFAPKRDDYSVMSWQRREAVAAWLQDPRTRDHYDGDWILWPPRQPGEDP